ncbi:MAG: DEAD/DEAH box helicase [Chlorobi bacterium]|nr:DEAD/DEAH box helicase [Chlorobiota bacterium]
MQKFIETGLNKELIQAIEELGFEEPTPIQSKTIPELLQNGNDLVALAQTGTGKTGAFGLPVIQLIDTSNKDVQALVMCPTRELCLQITKDIKAYSKYSKDIDVTPVYGGSDIRTQIKALKKGSHIVVGTPGRLNDLINRKVLHLDKLRWLILDEADEMLNMGFKDDLETIIQQTPESRQTLLFSATMPDAIARIAKKYMHNPVELRAGKKNSGAENVKHEFYMVHASDRYKALKRIVDVNPNIYGIIFCRTRQETKDIADSLIGDGYNADALHGDLTQAQRDVVMHRFRTKHLQLLVATDVAARGIDVTELTHVINYNLPDDAEVYIHRSGRTGRAGKSGTCASIIHTRESRKIREIEKLLKKPIERKLVPTAEEITQKQLFHFIDKMENVDISEDTISQFLPAIYSKLAWLDREELIKRFVTLEFQRFADYYKNAPDINIYKEEEAYSKKRNQFSRLFINAGKEDKLTSRDIIDLVNKKVRARGIEIGKIEILKTFSFFEVDSDYERDVIKGLSKVPFNGKRLSVEPASPKPGGRGRRNKGRRRRY